MVMAGGTGGHIFPALAVADRVRAGGWRVVWLATRRGMEVGVAERHGFDLALLSFAGVRGHGALRWAFLPGRLLLAFFQAARTIFRERPDVILGMGGYAAFPGGMMAVLLRRPLVIHEQNAVAGLANRVLACVADRVLAAFPQAFQGHDRPPCGRVGVRCVGNPVRADIAQVPPPPARFAGRTGRLRLLVVGGSLGAQALNDALPRALALLTPEARPEVVHQSGERHLAGLNAAYAAAGVSAQTHAFLDDMAARYAWCDLAVCRAGATTVAELAAAGVGAVLVPYPHAVDDHQTRNAEFLSGAGAAVLLPQAEFNPERLADALRGLDRARLADMAGRARALGRADAAGAVSAEIVGLAP